MQLRQTLAREIDVKAGKPGFLLFDKATRSGTKDGTNLFEVLLGLGFQWVINYLQIKIILGILDCASVDGARRNFDSTCGVVCQT